MKEGSQNNMKILLRGDIVNLALLIWFSKSKSLLTNHSSMTSDWLTAHSYFSILTPATGSANNIDYVE